MSWKWSVAALTAALTVMTAPAAFGASDDPPASAGWHGRAIRDPLPRHAAHPVARFPRDWSAGPLHLGAGYASPHGSRRVREVQRRLRRRGYRPGPVDGRFGPRTRAAVTWFEIKHGLPRTGRVDARTLATLRRRPPARRPAAPAPTPASTPTPPRERSASRPTTPPQASTASTTPVGLIGVAVGLLLGLALALGFTRATRRGQPVPGSELPAAARAGAWDQSPGSLTSGPPVPPPPALADVIGYAAIPHGSGAEQALDACGEAIASWCERRGWQLTRLVRDLVPPSAPLSDRPGLAQALEQIDGGRAGGLVLARLSDLTRTAAELALVLQRLNRAGAFLVALDCELDTTTRAGRVATRTLIEIAGWEPGRITQVGPPTPPAGNRSMRDFGARIAAMRERGLSLQAICDILNAEGVPTPWPDTHWRPSTVDTASHAPWPPADPGALHLAPHANGDR